MNIHFPLTLAEINLGLETFENTLNVLGYIPVLSVISSEIRCVYGLAQIVTGYALGIIFGIGLLISKALNSPAVGLFHQSFMTIMPYGFHGFANVFRAYAERELFLFSILAYDLSFDRLSYP